MKASRSSASPLSHHVDILTVVLDQLSFLGVAHAAARRWTCRRAPRWRCRWWADGASFAVIDSEGTLHVFD